MDKKNVLEIYNAAYAEEYNHKFIFNDWFRDNAKFEQEIITELLEEIGEEVKWLDIACGTGYFLSLFPGVERAGLDISPAMLNIAKQANPDVLLVEGDFRNEYPQWKGKWNLVSCMWWAYSYVESLSEVEKVIKNLADWTSERGVCFLPIGSPKEIGIGELNLPYVIEDVPVYGGQIQLEGLIWSWIDENSQKQHLNLLAPQPEYMISLMKKYFDDVEIIEYPSHRKAVIARSKKQKHTSKAESIDKIQFWEILSSSSKIIRADDWWPYKIPPLLGIAYAEILLMDLPFTQAIATLLALISISICAAAYGHVINDCFDVEVDQQVGKSNSMAQFAFWQRALFCLALAGLGVSLPVLMNFGTLALSLLGINYLLPTLYSVPPFRFKEKGILGIISDAAGAHAVPTLFITATFTHIAAAPLLQTHHRHRLGLLRGTARHSFTSTLGSQR